MTIDDLINLLYTPMTDDAVIETVETLGISLPTDADYSYEDEVVTTDKNNTGLILTFNNIEGVSSESGDLLLSGIEIGKNCAIDLPYSINSSDSYAQIVEKVGQPATYKDEFDELMRVFLIQREDERKYAICVTFDGELKVIQSFVIITFVEGDDEFLIKLEG